jgi:hypothetical protein
MPACRQAGCSNSVRSSRPGRSVFRDRAASVKNRNASKCEQAMRWLSTTSSVAALPSRSGQEECRTSSAGSR